MAYPKKLPLRLKCLAFIFLLSALSLSAPCQTPNTKELLKQKKTQRTYFAQQLAYLQTYKELLEKGYDIANKGLSRIGIHETATFGTNQAYWSSLNTISPEIQATQSSTDVLAIQTFIIKSFQTLIRECNASENFSEREKHYIETVGANVRTKCTQTVLQMRTITASDSTTMTDSDRMQRINQLTADMQEHKSFTIAFCASTRSLGAQRAKEKREAAIRRQLNGINP